MVGVAGEMNLAVLADHPPLPVDDDRGVVMTDLLVFQGQLRIAEAKANLQALGFLEQRGGIRPRHLALEEAVDLLLVFHPPAGEERGQRDLGVDDHFALHVVRLAHQVDQPGNHRLAAVVARDRAQLCRRYGKNSCHVRTLLNALPPAKGITGPFWLFFRLR